MSGMKEIFCKELARVFKDRKMVFSVFILPVVIMIGIMSVMSSMIGKMEDNIDSHKPIVCIRNEADSFQSYIQSQDLDYEIKVLTSNDDMKDVKNKILSGEADLLIEFPEGFDAAISTYKEGDAVPQIKTYYNPSEDYSDVAYSEVAQGVLESYRTKLLADRVGNLDQIAVFTVNSDNQEMVIQDEDKASGKALGMMLPYFITILLFAGAMGIGTDMIAGEKERGTMASLLVSPIKRSSIVLGKVFSLMTISGISSLVYVVAMVVFMPMMMDSFTGGSESGFKLSFGIGQIVMLAALLIALAFLYSTMIALVSVFAKTVKEASTYVMPAYMLVLVVGIMTMFNAGETPMYAYMIPVYNSSMAFKGILSQDISILQYGLTLGITLILGAVLTGIIVKAFESEKVMSQ